MKRSSAIKRIKHHYLEFCSSREARFEATLPPNFITKQPLCSYYKLPYINKLLLQHYEFLFSFIKYNSVGTRTVQSTTTMNLKS